MVKDYKKLYEELKLRGFKNRPEKIKATTFRGEEAATLIEQGYVLINDEWVLND